MLDTSVEIRTCLRITIPGPSTLKGRPWTRPCGPRSVGCPRLTVQPSSMAGRTADSAHPGGLGPDPHGDGE